MNRSQAVQDLLDCLNKETFGITVDEAQEQRICISCKELIEVTSFKDQINKNEYMISGLCQKCQDKIFTFIEVHGIEVEEHETEET